MKTVLLCAVGITLTCATAEARDLRVPQDYPTVTAALAAATSGDKVRIAKGRHVGGGQLKDNVDVQGDDGAIIDASGTAQGLWGDASIVHGLKIQNVTIENAFNDGLRLIGTNNVSFDQLTLANNGNRGLEADAATNTRGDHFTVLNNGAQGVEIEGGSIQLDHTDVEGNGAAGLRFGVGAVAKIDHTSATKNSGFGGIRVFGGATLNADHTTVDDNFTNGLYVDDGTATIDHLEANGNQGVGVYVGAPARLTLTHAAVDHNLAQGVQGFGWLSFSDGEILDNGGDGAVVECSGTIHFSHSHFGGNGGAQILFFSGATLTQDHDTGGTVTTVFGCGGGIG